jgi:hypothetical protein
MPDELPRFLAGRPEAQPIHHIVQPALEQSQQRFTGDPCPPLGPLEDAAELPFLKAIDAPQLLLLTQLRAVIRNARPRLSMLAGRIASALDRALFRHAARTFQKQFLAFTAA